MLFCEEKPNLKPSYVNDKKLLKLISIAENSIKQFNKTNDKIPKRLDYSEKKEKLTDLPFIVLTDPFNKYMLTLQI